MHPELLVRKRMMLLTLVLLVLFGLVLLRVGRLTTVQSEELTQRGVNQWTKAGTVTARRGKIVDRNGNVLAYNELAYDVTIQDTGAYKTDAQWRSACCFR